MQSAVQELLSCVAEANAESARPGKYSSFMTDRKREKEQGTGNRELRTMVSGITGLYWKIYNIPY